MLRILVLVMLATDWLSADTITLTDNRLIHGRVTFRNGVFKLLTRYGKDQEKLLSFDSSQIRNVRFNRTTYNPEPPDLELVARGGMSGKGSAKPTCDIVGEEKLSGELNAITEQEILIGQRKIDRNKVMVLQIRP